MPAPILLTKLFVPAVRPELVSRSHLIEQLNRGLNRKLSLISAPAGFGKTTLVTEWLQSQGDDASSPFFVSWLSLDEGDNDVVRFLTYLISALNRLSGLETEIGVGALQMLQSPQPPSPETILVAAINEIAMGTNKIVLVLDDYHLIDSQSVHDNLNFLIENIPPQLHLVITTREDPPIQTSRLRARGQLTEIRAVDLRFSSTEAAEFLNQVMGLNLAAEDITALETRTEGWITGLQMAVISMQGSQDVEGFIRSFTGSHRYVLDYLIEEVLDQQPEEIQNFLLQTAILDRLTGSLCDAVRFGYTETPSSSKGTAVTGQENGRETLETLERANLFIISLDNEWRWYRYHHLFAELLRYRLQREQASTIPELNRRASKWHEEHGFIDRAIRHAIAADDLEQAARLVDEHSHPANERGDVSTVRGWFELLPDGMVRSDPSLSVACAWNLYLNGQISAVEDRLQDAESLLSKQTASISTEQVAELVGKITVLRAILFGVQGKPIRGIELAQQMLEYIPEDNLSARGITLITLGRLFSDVGDITQASRSFAEAVSVLLASENVLAAVIAVEQRVRLLVIQGQLVKAVDVCKEMLNLSGALNVQGKIRALVSDMTRSILSKVLYERNELTDAELYVRQGIKQAKRGGFFELLVFAQILLARILQSRGDADGANKLLQIAMNSTQMNSSQRYRPDLTACQVQLWLAQNDLAAASRWAQASNLSTEVEFIPQNEFEHISLAQVLIAQGRAKSDGTTLANALELTNRLALSAESAGRKGHLINLLILQALALDAQGNLDQALPSLEEAIGLASPQGFVRIFVDKGLPMARLLYAALEKGINPNYVQILLAAFPVAEPEKAAIHQPSASASVWIEPLSDRELEVLQLIADGLSRQEIATKLVLSLNTVKTHLRNIYSKLGVNNQMQAVGKARTLGLLEE